MSSGKTPPLASLIIPTYARPDRLAQCLEAATQLQGPDFEVIVVDDGSPRPIAPVCDGFSDRLQISCHRQENMGPGMARNKGAQHARGQLLLFTDDDCLPDPLWLASIATAFERDPGALYGGMVLNGLANNPYAAASQDIQTFLYQSDASALAFFASNNLACGRETFLQLGGFSEHLPRASEDREFSMRWRNSGRPVHFVDQAIVHHFHDLTLRSFCQQHFNYGRGAKDLAKLADAAGIADRPKPRSAGFYRDLVTFPLQQPGPYRPYRAALVALAQLATAAGYYA